METTNSSLLKALHSFSFDEPNASFTFAQRLAKENDWTPAHAERVIAEYRRFIFLAVSAGHPVSPSDAVDQAWHVHLTYTVSYWKKLCGEVLQQPLHHHPTKGGSAERTKFDDWYRKTLESYERFFGEPAPEDIWPRPGTALPKHPETLKVDRARHWIIPKPNLRRLWRPVAFVVAFATVGVGCGSSVMGSTSIFDLRGPDFLKFYFSAMVVTFVLAILVRRYFRKPDGVVLQSDLPTDPYVIAALSGGPVQVVNAAIAKLCNMKVLRVTEGNTRPTITVTHPLQEAVHPIEAQVYKACAACSEIKIVRQSLAPSVKTIDDQLKTKGWLVNDKLVHRAIAIPLLICSLLILVGVLKVIIGLSRNKPVEFLIAMVTVTGIVALIAFARRPRRSLLGSRILEATRSKYAKLKSDSNFDQTGDALPLAVGLFGLGVLASTSLSNLKRRLTPPAGYSSASCGSGCGSGCGGGGCGGGCGGCGGGGD